MATRLSDEADFLALTRGHAGTSRARLGLCEGELDLGVHGGEPDLDVRGGELDLGVRGGESDLGVRGGGSWTSVCARGRSFARVVLREQVLVALAPKFNARRHKVKAKIEVKVNLKVKLAVVAKPEHQFEGMLLRSTSLCRPQEAPLPCSCPMPAWRTCPRCSRDRSWLSAPSVRMLRRTRSPVRSYAHSWRTYTLPPFF